MNTNRHIHRVRSLIVVGLTLLFLIIFGRHDLPLMMFGFAFMQLVMGPISLILILLRISTLLKNKNAPFYYLAGAIQVGLSVIDTILLFSNQVIKSNLVIFLALNAVLAAAIFFDVYKPHYAGGSIEGTLGSLAAHHQNNWPGDRKTGKPFFEESVEQDSETLPENIG